MSNFNKGVFTFSTNFLFFWLKGKIDVDGRFVKIRTRNNILGLIPAGSNDESIPLKNISACRLTTKYKVFPMFLGVIFVVAGFSMIGDEFGSALVAILLGVALFGSGILTTLVVQRAGNDYYLSVPFYSKGNILNAKDLIEEALAYDTDKTDLGQYFDKKEQ